jgi:hypothetical protein
MAANELYEKASSNGYSQSQLTRAGKRIGVRKDKAGVDGYGACLQKRHQV